MADDWRELINPWDWEFEQIDWDAAANVFGDGYKRPRPEVFVYRFGTWSGKGLIGAGLAVFWRRGPASADRGQCAAAA